MSHAIFCLLKIPILSHKPLRTGVQPKLKHFQTEILIYGACNSNLRCKDKSYMKNTTFIRFIPAIHAENPAHTLSSFGGLHNQKSSWSCDLRFWRVWSWSGYADEPSKRCAIFLQGCQFAYFLAGFSEFGDMEGYIQRRGRLPVREAVPYFAELVHAVCLLHDVSDVMSYITWLL